MDVDLLKLLINCDFPEKIINPQPVEDFDFLKFGPLDFQSNLPGIFHFSASSSLEIHVFSSNFDVIYPPVKNYSVIPRTFYYTPPGIIH